MANIPVERTSTGVPPWLWLVGALLLGLLAWFLIETFGDNEEGEIAEDNTEVVAPPVVADMDLSDVYVTRVVGDNTFFVASTPGGSDERLVYLEEEAEAGNGAEGRYDVTEGQHLSITGSMEPTPADITPWGLTDEQANGVGDQYIRATSLTVLDDAMAGDEMADDAMPAEGAGLAMLDGDLSAMAGQAIALDAVRVTSVTGDSTFTVGDGAQRTAVVLESLGESQTGPGDGSDGVFDVNVGDTVTIDGTVRAFQRGMQGTTDMSEANQAAAEARRYVIVITGRDGFSKQ